MASGQDQEKASPSFADRLKQTGANIALNAKLAGQLTAKQAERSKINAFSLANAYLALGSDIHLRRRYSDDFAGQFEKIDALLAQIAGLGQPTDERRQAGFGGKAKQFAKKAKNLTHSQALTLRVNRNLGKLGQVAFQEFGAASGPVELIDPIEMCIARLGTLGTEIAVLQSKGDWRSTPARKRAVFAVVGSLIIGVIIFKSISQQRPVNAVAESHNSSTDPPVTLLPSNGSVATKDAADSDFLPASGNQKADPSAPTLSIELSSVDMNHGPQGQEIIEREQGNSTSVENERFYRGGDGALYRHGIQRSYMRKSAATREVWKSFESEWVYGIRHGYDVQFAPNGVATMTFLYRNGKQVQMVSRDGQGNITYDSKQWDRPLEGPKDHPDPKAGSATTGAPTPDIPDMKISTGPHGEKLYVGGKVDKTVPNVAPAAGPHGEKLYTGGNGLNTKMYYHYYIDNKEKEIKHGQSQETDVNEIKQQRWYVDGKVVSTADVDSEGRVISKSIQKLDGLWDEDRYVYYSTEGMYSHSSYRSNMEQTGSALVFKELDKKEVYRKWHPNGVQWLATEMDALGKTLYVQKWSESGTLLISSGVKDGVRLEPPFSPVAGALTKAEFKLRLKAIMNRGRLDQMGTLVVCDYREFIQVFGEPQGNSQYPGYKRLWRYDCADGLLTLRMELTPDLAIVEAINSY